MKLCGLEVHALWRRVAWLLLLTRALSLSAEESLVGPSYRKDKTEDYSQLHVAECYMGIGKQCVSVNTPSDE